MLLTTSLQAQQTITTCELKEGYLPYAWMENTDSVEMIIGYANLGSKETLLRAKYLYVEDVVPVYGIAAGLTTIVYGEEAATNVLLNNSWDNAFEYITLYKNDADTLGLTPVSDSLVFHLRDTPVSYYMNLGCGAECNFNGIEQDIVIPVYERYFVGFH